MSYRVRLAGLAIGVLFISQAHAQVEAPKYSNEFLSIGVGARAMALGNTQSAIANDVTAGFWNPAGLLRTTHKYNVALMHSELFAGIAKHDYGAFSTPLDSMSALGFSFVRLGVDDIANTLNLVDGTTGAVNYNNITYFSVADYALYTSYARRSRLIQGLQLGGSAKIVYRNVGDFANAWGFGIDVGAQLQRGNWQFGLMAKDITTTFNAWSFNSENLKFSDTDSLNTVPDNNVELTLPKLIPGVAYTVNITDKFAALVAVDLDMTFDGKRNTLIKSDFASVDPHGGLELSYNKLVYVRGGLNNIQEYKKLGGGTSRKVQPNFGVGVSTHGLNVDLALAKVADNSNINSVIVSLGYRFNK